MKKISIKAFSMAEILIALMVLGVLMAMSLPTLLVSYKKSTIQASFADVYKETNKALFNYSVRNNCQGRLSCTNIFGENVNAAEKIASEFQAIRKGTNCWNGKANSNEFIELDSLNCFVDGKNRIFAIENKSGSCEEDNTEKDKHKLKKTCGYLYVDIDGEGGTNTFGKDIFMFIITDVAPSYLYPNGGKLIKENDENLKNWTKDNCNSSGGITCAGRIVEEGMKVNYLN